MKFRAWDGKEMRLAFDLTQNPKYWWEGNRDYPLTQYTGLKDKNGQEIYEGDVLDYKWKSSNSDLLIVEWSEADACFLMGGVRTDYAIAYGEVIGNIYQNPELLGTKL